MSKSTKNALTRSGDYSDNKTKLETKTSPRRHCSTGRILSHAYESGVKFYSVNSNYTKYLAQPCCRFFCVLENFRRKFANLVAPHTDITTVTQVQNSLKVVLENLLPV